MMRWFFREIDLACDDPPGLVALFNEMKPYLEYDAARFIWIVRR